MTGAIVALVLWVVVGMFIAPSIVYAIFAMIGTAVGWKNESAGTMAGGIIVGWALSIAVFIFSTVEAIVALFHLIAVAGGH